MVLLLIFVSVLSFMRAGLWNDAVAIWGDAVTKSPRSYRALNNLGGGYKKKKMWDAAARYWRAALEVNPYYAPSHSSLASFYITKSLWVESEHELLLALRFGPPYADIYRRLGYVRLKLGDMDGAIVNFERAVALNINDEAAVTGLVKLYTDKGYGLGKDGYYRDSLALFKKAEALRPENLPAIYGLALSYEGVGRLAEASRYWDEYIALAPADDPYVDAAVNHIKKLRNRHH